MADPYSQDGSRAAPEKGFGGILERGRKYPGQEWASRSGFGSIGRFCRLVTSLTGGALLGSAFGTAAGVAGVALGLLVFALSERGHR